DSRPCFTCAELENTGFDPLRSPDDQALVCENLGEVLLSVKYSGSGQLRNQEPMRSEESASVLEARLLLIVGRMTLPDGLVPWTLGSRCRVSWTRFLRRNLRYTVAR